MKKERWRLYAKKADFAAISKEYGINQVTARIMRNRGVETKEEIESYLKGDLDYLSDPALMKDADKAASLLEAAIANNELIAISSDFDNDGIFSGLLLKEAIIELGGRAAIFTPNRVMEGYGVNSRIVEEANAKGASVLLTCDNGIAAFEAIIMRFHSRSMMEKRHIFCRRLMLLLTQSRKTVHIHLKVFVEQA